MCGWLTHGDMAMEAHVDFLAVIEHRLISARVRCEWARLKGKGMSSVWAAASQDSSHVGHAGFGVVSLRGAPVALPTFATAHFRRFFSIVRVLCVACCLLGAGRLKYLLFCMAIKGADTDAE